ncbi:MAG: transposase, partial [Candidatus Omnitrophica bacterium]|nr:transposase [Candidatus Omnitrophota bacterium]
DYRFYLERLNEYRNRYKLSILSYCLMPNHVHFVAIPENKDSLAKTFNVSHMRYAHYFNKKNKIVGHLWQGRFYSCVLDDTHLYATVRYIENNPVRAGLVKRAWDWKWSSAREHVLKEGKCLLFLTDVNKFMEIDNWKSYLFNKEKETVINSIRKNTLTGRPLGDDIFVAELEKLFSKRLRALPRGRPKNE